MRSSLVLSLLTLVGAAVAADNAVGMEGRLSLGYAPSFNSIDGEDWKDKGGVEIQPAFFVNGAINPTMNWVAGLGLPIRMTSSEDKASGVVKADTSTYGLRLNGGVEWIAAKNISVEPLIFVGYGAAKSKIKDIPGVGDVNASGNYSEYGIQVSGFYKIEKCKAGIYLGYAGFSSNLDIDGDDVKAKGAGIIIGLTGGYSF